MALLRHDFAPTQRPARRFPCRAPAARALPPETVRRPCVFARALETPEARQRSDWRASVVIAIVLAVATGAAGYGAWRQMVAPIDAAAGVIADVAEIATPGADDGGSLAEAREAFQDAETRAARSGGPADRGEAAQALDRFRTAIDRPDR